MSFGEMKLKLLAGHYADDLYSEDTWQHAKRLTFYRWLYRIGILNEGI